MSLPEAGDTSRRPRHPKGQVPPVSWDTDADRSIDSGTSLCPPSCSFTNGYQVTEGESCDTTNTCVHSLDPGCRQTTCCTIDERTWFPVIPTENKTSDAYGLAPKAAKMVATDDHVKRTDHHYNLARYYRQRALRRWRQATARMRMLPRFIVAGAPKCGTTALYFYLLSHPQVAGPSQNEMGFFSQNYEHGLDWYRSHFPIKMVTSWRARYSGKEIITGEHTPAYVMHPLAAQRMADTLPDVRLIILLRDPVERAYSHYQHEFRCGHENLCFRDAIAMEPQRTAQELDRMRSELGYRGPEYVRHAYLDQGKYRPKLEQFFRHFDRSQIMIIKSENLFEQTQDVLDEVLDFLCLDPFKLKNVERVNSGEYMPLREADPSLESALREHFAPSNESLYSLLGINFGW